MTEAAPGKVGRDEQGEARRANTTPNGWWTSSRARELRLNIWLKSDLSIAETTGSTYLDTPYMRVFTRDKGV